MQKDQQIQLEQKVKQIEEEFDQKYDQIFKDFNSYDCSLQPEENTTYLNACMKIMDIISQIDDQKIIDALIYEKRKPTFEIIKERQNNIDIVQKNIESIEQIHQEIEEQIKDQKIKIQEIIDQNQEKIDIQKQNQNEIQSRQQTLDLLQQQQQIYDNQLNTLKEECEQKSEYIKVLQKQNDEKDKEQQKMSEEIKKLQNEIPVMHDEMMQNIQVNKVLNNKIVEMHSNIRIYCRIRPFIGKEKEKEENQNYISSTQYMITLNTPPAYVKSDNTLKDHLFSYEQIFNQQCTQQYIFSFVEEIVKSAIDGYKVCIFAYGQTGSGKTHTMEGTDEQQGIIPRAVDYIFNLIQQFSYFQWKYTVSVAFQEVYMDEQRDLLNEKKHQPQKDFQVKVETVSCPQEVHRLLAKAKENRKTACTKANEYSSRSHFIFQLLLQGRNDKVDKYTEGSLNLIDLAGSERLCQSQTEGMGLKETVFINKSLTALGDVIMAIKNNEPFVPYRNSKLTHVLQPYLGGDCKTLMFVNIDPVQSSFNQTLQSLRFASKVNECKIKSNNKKKDKKSKKSE